MNAPIENIREQYRLKPQEHPFEWYQNWHLEHGFLHSTPDFFVMGFRVDSVAIRLGNSPLDCYQEDGDCWYVGAMSGSMEKAWKVLPLDLPFMAWDRDRGEGKDLQIWDQTRIQRLTGGTVT